MIPAAGFCCARNHSRAAAAAANDNQHGSNDKMFMIEPTNVLWQALCLRGNRLSDAGVKSLADGIASNNSCVRARELAAPVVIVCLSCAIVELDISDNKFSTRGGQAIGQLLKENRSITDMDVSYNCMRPPACAAVLQVRPPRHNCHATTIVASTLAC